jgi:hypothetical protein
MENKIRAANFDRYHYVIANWYFLIQEHESCIKRLDDAIKISDKTEYRLMRARSLHTLADRIYSSNNTKPIDILQFEELIETNEEIKVSRNLIQNSKDDIKFVRRKDPKNEFYKSLEEVIQDLLIKIDARMDIAHDREMQLRADIMEEEERKNERREQEEHDKEERERRAQEERNRRAGD